MIKKFNKAVDMLNAENLGEAELEFAKILEDEPGFTEAWVAIAEINYTKSNQHQIRKLRINIIVIISNLLKVLLLHALPFKIMKQIIN